MALGEFSLIDRFFARPAPGNTLGVGDDAARIELPAATALVICKDLLIEGRHFFSDVAPQTLGHKALAVNLSDLAAMGAQPLGCLLGLGIPKPEEHWLESFAQGFHALSAQAQCPLLGGDTVRHEQGVLISVTAFGTLPLSHPGLRRSAAQAGDDLWVSGSLGAADIALSLLRGELPADAELLAQVRPALESPTPRLSLGLALLDLAHAAIDISDGLTQDLSHVLKASHCGAVIDLASLPAHPALSNLPPARVLSAMLHGGDVYELCFTADPSNRHAIAALSGQLMLPLTRIGQITSQPGLFASQANGQQISLTARGFDHFAR
jgi:thiamine-monophosphate kinase